MEARGVDLLSVEVLQMFLEDLVCRLVSLAEVLQDLEGTISQGEPSSD